MNKKVGICFGCYSPLHQGHLDVIMKAKKENDITFVFVCGYDGQSRADDYNLPLLKRYRIIKNYLDDETVTVKMINDTELGIDQSESDYNWTIWSNKVYDIISTCGYGDENYCEYTWYVAELKYKAALSRNCCFKHSTIVLNRADNPISGTLCRTQPLKYWNKITAPFRAYFSHNILITGTASEGKTTLTQDIGKYFGIPYSYEKGRDNCKLKTDPEFTVKDFMYNIYEQHKYNEELISSPQNPGIFISDTDNFVTLMYANAYKNREGFGINDKEYKVLELMTEAYIPTTKWDKIFLIKPRLQDIVDDGERYLPDSVYEIRVSFYNFLKSLYDKYGFEYEEINGTYYENFCKVRDYINGLYE